MKMNATVAFAAAGLLCSANCALAMVIPSQTTAHAAIEDNIRGRLPTLSTRAAPVSAKTNWKQEYPRLILVCVTESW
jgi:hypothetical protein